MSNAGRLGSTLMIAGAVAALMIAAVVAWADFEGLSYFQNRAAYPTFGGLSCPSLISRSEQGIVTARFDNPSAKTIQPRYKATVSGTTDFREVEDQITLPPHESRVVAWTVNADDIDLGFFVLLKLDVFPVAGFATRESTCGILAFDLGGLSGRQALTLAVTFSVLLTTLGLLLPVALMSAKERRQYDREAISPRRRALQALSIVSAAAMLPALAGAWLAAWILCIIGLLLLLILLRGSST